MKLRVPFYYDQFHCITSECKDNCCVGGWEIDIDDDTYNYYMSLDGELGDRIRESITKSEDGSNCFKLVDGHCGLLDKCGLCTIHKELGAEHLSVVCNQFPRYSEYYGEIKESGIGLACEEAERIIFSENKTFTTVLKPCDEEYSEDDEYDSAYAVRIFKARDEIFKILDMPEMSINEKLVVILKYCASIQEYINNDEEKEYKVKKSVKVKDTKDKANIRYRKLYKKYAKSKKVVTKSKLAGAKVDSHMMPEEITSKLITDDEAKARRITDDYEKARYSNGEVSEEDISFLKNFK